MYLFLQLIAFFSVLFCVCVSHLAHHYGILLTYRLCNSSSDLERCIFQFVYLSIDFTVKTLQGGALSRIEERFSSRLP